MTRAFHFTAAPAFALMALVTGALDNGAPSTLCSAASGVWLGGMTPMYLLMAIFHSSPWLKLFTSREAVTPFVRLDRSNDIETMEQEP